MDVQEIESRLKSYSRRETNDYIEKAGTLDHEGLLLFSLTVKPIDGTRATGIVVCPSLFELRTMQRWEVSLLRAGAEQGFPGIYLQPPGAGDSEGPKEPCSIEARVRTAVAAADSLRETHPGLQRICYFGARLGGTISILASARSDREASLVLWDPVTDISTYWTQACRFNRLNLAARIDRWEEPAKQLRRRGWTEVVQTAIRPSILDDLATATRHLEDGNLGVGPTLLRSWQDEQIGRLAEVLRSTRPVDLVRLDLPRGTGVGLWQANRTLVKETVEWMTEKLD